MNGLDTTMRAMLAQSEKHISQATNPACSQPAAVAAATQAMGTRSAMSPTVSDMLSQSPVATSADTLPRAQGHPGSADGDVSRQQRRRELQTQLHITRQRLAHEQSLRIDRETQLAEMDHVARVARMDGSNLHHRLQAQGILPVFPPQAVAALPPPAAGTLLPPGVRAATGTAKVERNVLLGRQAQLTKQLHQEKALRVRAESVVASMRESQSCAS
jgi:hypothetical protein